MDAERLSRARKLFLALRERRPEQRRAQLAAKCAEDEELRLEVESLLLDHDRVRADRPAGVSDAEAGLEVPDLEAPDLVASVGETLGRYRILGLVGRGGMGAVYEAEDPELGRRVALKVLPLGFAADPDRLGRFKREARALAALNHPNVVTIHSVEKSTARDGADVHFLTMELVPGEPLSRRIPEQGLEVPELLKIASQVADGLRAAHDQGIVHRDLKPDNIMVDPEGRVRILDFGLAKNTVADPDEGDDAPRSELLTRAGVVMGTVPYMSPEQVAGREVDPRTDVFSLGVILYEMAAGLRPFRGDSRAELASAILRDPPPPLAHQRNDLPADLIRLIDRCLEKEPGARFQNLRDVLSALQQVDPDASGPRTGRDAPMSVESGANLGGYRIIGPVGAGAMGEVYRARDTELGREVAIRLLPPDVATDPIRRERLEREVGALAALDHPNVAALYGFETARLSSRRSADDDEQETPFLVMELVEGPTLAERLERGPIPWRRASSVFLAIARGLEAAHERGIVHRDLKPANLKVSDDGVKGTAPTGPVHVKVLDLGLAKALSVEPKSDPARAPEDFENLTLPATAPGVLMGTPDYWAPEQFRRSAVDKRADVWAFGVCLFETLTGRSPFGGESASDRLTDAPEGAALDEASLEHAVLGDEPAWDLLPADVPRALTTLLRRCLRKPPADRLRDIGEARVALSDLLADPEAAEQLGQPPMASPELAGATIRRGPAFAAVALVTALAAATVTWLLVRGEGGTAARSAAGDSSGPAIRFSVGNEQEEPFGDVGGVLISPNGRWVVVSGGSEESEGAVVGRVAGTEPLRIRALDAFDDSVRVLEGTAGALYPFFSPDSQWVGFFLGGGGVRTLHRVSLESGVVQPITTDPHPGYRAEWIDDDHIVVGSQRSGLARVDVTTGTLEPFTSIATDAGELAHVNPEVLPKGRGIVFTALGVQDASFQIRVWDARTDAVRTLVPRGGEARYLPSGQLLYGLDGALYAVELDLDRLETVGDPRPVVQGVATGTLGEAYFDVSNDGTLVYLPGSEQRARPLSLVWVRPDGSVEEELDRGDIQFPTIAPDGQRWLARTSRTELAVFERGAPLPRKFSTRVPPATASLFFGDSSILYGQPGSGARQSSLYVLDMVTGTSTPFGRGDDENRVPVALDGSRNEVISLTTIPTTAGAWRTSLVASDLTGEGPDRDLVSGDVVVGGARLSPDGTRLAYSVLTSDSFTQISTLYVADYPDMKRRLAISDGMNDNGYAWAPDGRLWFADAPEHTLRAVSFAPGPLLEVSSIDPVFDFGVQFWLERGFAVAPDGRLLMVRGTREAGGLSGRIRVVVGWAREQGLE